MTREIVLFIIFAAAMGALIWAYLAITRKFRCQRDETLRALAVSFGVRLAGDDLRGIMAAAEGYGVSIGAYLRAAGLALAAARGTARCEHMAVSNVASAECGICGPLPVELTVRVPGGAS